MDTSTQDTIKQKPHSVFISLVDTLCGAMPSFALSVSARHLLLLLIMPFLLNVVVISQLVLAEPIEETNSPTANSGSWSNAANAYLSNGNYASSSTNGAEHVYQDYGFSLAGNTINQVEIGIEYYYQDANWHIGFQESWDGGTTWSSLNETLPDKTSDDNTVVWTDVTDDVSWTPEMLNDANFRVRVKAVRESYMRTVYIDYIPVRVTYTPLTGGDANTAPTITNVASSTPTRTQVHITWDTNQSDSNNRVIYSENSDLSGSTWSSWDNDTDSVNVHLTGLSPETKYYYSAYSYNGTNISLYSNSSINNFTTAGSTNAHGHVKNKDGDSISTIITVYDEDGTTILYNITGNTLDFEEVPIGGYLLFDALESINVSAMFKINGSLTNFDIIFDDYGLDNPESTASPGNQMKYIDVSAVNVSYESVVIKMHYTDAELGDLNEGNLKIYHHKNGAWNQLSTTVDQANNTLTAQTTSLSTFGGASVDEDGYRLICWTDRKVYDHDAYDMHTGSVFTVGNGDNPDESVTVFAVLMDANGSIVNDSNLNFGGRLYDEEIWDHSNTTEHHTILNQTNLNFSNNYFIDSDFSEIGSTGIYQMTAIAAMELGSWLTQEHLLINITINETGVSNGVSYTTHVLFTRMACHHGIKGSSTAHVRHVEDGPTPRSPPCTVCHWGYEHNFGQDMTRSESYEEDILGGNVHTGIYGWNPLSPSGSDEPGIYDHLTGMATGTVSTGDEPWEDVAPGSEWCYSCHYDSANEVWLDYDSGARASCSESDSRAGGGLECHDRTDITNTSLAESETDWYWKDNGSSNTFDHGYDAASGKLPCEACHINVHGQQIPNMSVLGTDNHKHLEYQCFPCHDASDYYLNTSYESTSPGITGPVLHWKGQADCELCHVDANANSDAHWVPLGREGGSNCTACHKQTAAYAPWAVNESVFGESNYIHLHLNSNTTPSTVPEVNRICWACHGNVTWDGDNSIATEEMQPEHMHYLGEDWETNGPVYSDRIASCTDCHYEDVNDTTNYTYQFGAWPNIGHTWYASLITTPAATWCTDCHALSNFEVDLYYKNHNAPQRTDNSTVAHYGINQNAWAQSKLDDDEYCQICHQNGSTPIPMLQDEDKTRPDHNILPTTPSCTDDACHKSGRLHNDSLVKPVYTSANCTISGCHPTLQNHNGTVTCIDCHLKEQTHIHPIRFVNVNSGHFTTAKGVASRCRDCHDTNYANATQVNETIGIEPMVLPGAHGTGDMDGKLWIRNDQTYKGSMSIYSQDVQDTWDKPYWEFEPFVNAWVSDYSKAGGEDILNFTYMQNDAVNESAVIVEESIGGGHIHTYPSTDGYNESVYPYNQNFTLDDGSWTSATTGGGASSLNVSFDSSTGNPSGCLKVGLESDSTTSATGYWNVSFYYNNTDPPVEYAILENLDFKATGNDLSGDSWKFYVDVSKPDGTQTNVYTSSSYTVNPDWQSISDISVSPSFFDVDGWYKFSIRADITTAGGYMKKQIFYVTYPTVYFDNIDVKIKQNNIYNYDYNFTIENISRRAHYDLEYSYYVDTEAANMSIYNYTSSDWEHVDNLTKRGAWDARWVMNDNHISSSNQTKVRVYTEEDYTQDTLYIQYMLVHSHNETHYSCEYCHHSNKHYEEALGHVLDFNGNNLPTTPVNESNMCASCHYDQYVSGDENYQDMVDAYISFNESVPVEISSNATYGNYTVSLAGASYRDHIAQGDITPSNYDDLACIGCHGNSSSMEYVYQFIHSRTSGLESAGGSDCTSCHYDGSDISPVNHTSIKSGIHGSLNSDVGNSTPVTDEIDKACWACHGDGTENTSHNALIRNCDDCHVNLGSENFSAPQKLEHIPSGFYAASEINTTANCTTCHNNSIDLAHGDTDVKNINASVSHYGTITSLPDTYGTTNSSEGCVYCHLYSANASTWGDAVDLTVTTYPREHTETTNVECWTCHIDSNITVNSFHNVSLNPGWDPECTGCHYIYDYMSNKDSAIAGYFNGSDATKKYVNGTMYGDSVHTTLSCTNCHTDSERDEHPPTKGKRKSCESCHVVQSDHATDTNRHNITGTPSLYEVSGTSVVDITDCTTCHDSTVYANSIANFNRDATADCDYCHTYPDKNKESFY